LALIKCPDCGRDVSDLAPACPNCGRPVSTTAPTQPRGPVSGQGEVLKSNVDPVVAVASAPVKEKERSSPLALILLVVLLLLVGAGAALFWSASSQQRVQPVASPTVTAVPVVAVNTRGTAASSGVGAPLPDVNGISCDALESTIVHIHIHLAIFVNGDEQQIPFGIGIGQPWQVSDSDEGPFVDDGSCFYWIHTHTEDGVIHIESPVRRRFTLGDFFAIWQVPLTTNQVGPAQGQIITYVNGQRDSTSPSDIPLLAHERIQLDVGTDVPPYQFDFPPGD
jgi:hypothetical protein